MVWINKDTGVVLSKDGHTLFVDLVAEDEERERLAERSGLADPHGDMPDKEYLEAADGTRRIRTSAPESPTIWMPPSPNTGKADTPPTKAE